MIGFDEIVNGDVFLILPTFLEGSEVMLDGIEVWGVRWQEQQGGTGLLNQLGGFWRCVKGGVVHDHEVLGREARAQPRLQPGVEDPRIAGPFEQQRFLEPSLNARGQQRGPRPSMSRDQPIHALALRGIPIPSGGRRRKATFINMDELFTAAAEALTKAEKPSALPRVTFVIAHPFFYGSPAGVGRHAKYNAGRPGNVGPVLLGSDPDGRPHDGATRPNPVCEALVGRDACTRPRRA